MLIAKNININLLPILGYIALLPAIGFLYIYATNSRTSGPETFGAPIWWNTLRPIHSFLYFMFAFNAINKNKKSWIYLLIDVIIGLTSFIAYHYYVGDFSKLLY